MRFGSAAVVGGLVVAGIAVVALAQPAPPPAGGDDRVRAMFSQVDADRDGYVTRAEADAARATARTRMEAERKARRDRAFARLDTDRNGSISRREFDSAPRMGMADGPRGRRADGAGAMAMFDRMDGDRDGRVSLAEAEAWAGRRTAMQDGRRGAGRDRLPPGHPPVDGGANPRGLSDSDRPLGGGRD